MLTALVALALVVRCVGLGWGLPLVLEEAYPLKIAWRMWGWTGSPLTLDPQFYRYPSLVPYLDFVALGALRAGLAITGVARDDATLRLMQAGDPTLFYLLGRFLTAAMGALTIVPAWRIARVAAGPAAALMAGLLLAFDPLHVFHSQMIEVDVALTLFSTWALWRAIELYRSGAAASWREAALCGLATGLAASSKYPGALMLVPGLLAIVLSWRTRPATASVRLFVTLAATAFLVFAATSPYVFLSAAAAARDIAAERAHQGLGHFGSDAGAAWNFIARSLVAGLWGLPAGLGFLAGFAWLAGMRREPWAVIAASAVLSFVLLFGPSAVKADRYLLPLVPLGAVVVGVAIARLAERRPARGGRLALSAFLVLGCLAGMLRGWAPILGRMGPDSRLEARTWVEHHLPAGSLVVSELYGPPLVSPLQFAGALDRTAFHTLHDARADVRWWLVPVPMFQVQSERSAVYYDPRLYGSADAWVVTGSVRDRYRAEPRRFPVQNAFYDWLAARWSEVARIAATPGGGPEIVIYRNPAQQVPFGARVLPPPSPTPLMRQMRGIGGESAFYRAWGLNYLGFGHRAEAARAFEWALAFPVQSGGVTREDLLLDLAASRGAR